MTCSGGLVTWGLGLCDLHLVRPMTFKVMGRTIR